MKRVLAILVFIFMLCGCSSPKEPIDSAVALRETILSSNGVAFDAAITADYEDVIYTFRLDCTVNAEEALSFTVTEPKSISGISGIITEDQPSLTFNDTVLAFPPFADGQLSPVMAPYLFMNSLRSGFLSSCGIEGEGYCISIEDTFQNTPLLLQVFTDADSVPLRAEITYRNRRILSIDFYNFVVL